MKAGSVMEDAPWGIDANGRAPIKAVISGQHKVRRKLPKYGVVTGELRRRRRDEKARRPHSLLYPSLGIIPQVESNEIYILFTRHTLARVMGWR